MRIFKCLLKKQMYELNKSIFVNYKDGTKRSKGSVAGIVTFLGLLFLFLGVMFYLFASEMCKSFLAIDLVWLYFTIFGGLAIMLGVFGSVFNTYASLYKVKDNDLLLSMPIPAKCILLVRLTGVYLTVLLYTSIVMIPALIAFYIYCAPSFSAVVLSLVLFFMISLFVFSLCCILGYLVAKITAKIKNKSFVTVIVSLLFFAGYYALCFYSNEIISSIVASGTAFAGNVKKFAYPFYAMGKMCEGDWLAGLIFSSICIVIFALVYLVMSRSFLKIVISTTDNGSEVKTKEFKARSTNQALLSRELKRFFSSATYMLNCAIGSVFMLCISVYMLFSAGSIKMLLAELMPFLGDINVLFALILTLFLASMNEITSPSISLEGKNIWIVQSLPIDSFNILKAKINLHLIVTLPFVILTSICSCIAFKVEILASILILFTSVIFTFLEAEVGLAINLKFPNLNWQSESVAVKRGVAVMISMFGSGVFVIVLAVLFYFAKAVIEPTLFVVLSLAIVLALSIVLYFYLKNKGAKIFASLK